MRKINARTTRHAQSSPPSIQEQIIFLQNQAWTSFNLLFSFCFCPFRYNDLELTMHEPILLLMFPHYWATCLRYQFITSYKFAPGTALTLINRRAAQNMHYYIRVIHFPHSRICAFYPDSIHKCDWYSWAYLYRIIQPLSRGSFPQFQPIPSLHVTCG